MNARLCQDAAWKAAFPVRRLAGDGSPHHGTSYTFYMFYTAKIISSRLGGTPRPTMRSRRGATLPKPPRWRLPITFGHAGRMPLPFRPASLHDLPMAGLLVALATNKSLLHKCTYRRVDGVFIEPQFGHHPTIGKKRILPQSFINLTT